jgi:hypothetical protein
VSRLLIALAVVLSAAGCAGEQESGGERAPARAKPGDGENRPPPLRRARCPRGLSNCRESSGVIVYVERVDPDGDGDAHFVLLGDPGITAPGMTVVDVKRTLRPSPLPGPGDRLSAAGPVQEGSHGQRQIHAIELHVAR